MKKLFVIMATAITVLAGCNDTDDSYVPRLTEAEKEAGVFTPEIMLKMKRLGDTRLSPDGTQALYGITVYNVDDNKGYTNLWVKPMGEGEAV